MEEEFNFTASSLPSLINLGHMILFLLLLVLILIRLFFRGRALLGMMIAFLNVLVGIFFSIANCLAVDVVSWPSGYLLMSFYSIVGYQLFLIAFSLIGLSFLATIELKKSQSE